MAPKPPAELVRHLREGRCVLFCGSGLSAWAHLPTWKALLQGVVNQLAEETYEDSNLGELQRLIEAGKLLEVADHCKEALGQRYNNILSEKLRGATGAIPKPHKIIVQLPFYSVVTTNYDKLLERAYSSVDRLPKTPTHRDIDMLGPLLFDGGFFVLKAHGDIDRPDSMVLTARDYQEIIHANPSFNSIFSALLLTKAVLFIGYSLNDPDFRLLLDRQLTVFRGNIPERYALMTGIGKIEREVLWRAARIRVIPYEDGKHEQMLEFLQTLLNQMSSEAAAPNAAAPGAATEAIVVPRLPAKVVAPAAGSSPTLALGLRGQLIEASFGDGGNAVQGAGAALDSSDLMKMIGDALSYEPKARLLGKELARRLPEVVLHALREMPTDQAITLRLSPELDLLPWEWLFVDGNFLVLRNPLVRAPIGVSDTARGYPIVRQPARVLLIGDPNQQDNGALPGALAEIQQLTDVYSERPDIFHRSLIGPEASFNNVAAELSLGRYDVVHFAGHAWFDELEPYLWLCELVKLRASEMRSLLSLRPPAILFLNSHYTIFVPPGVPSGASGDKVLLDSTDPKEPALRGQRGFIEAASTAGVGALVGSFSGAVDDIIAQHVGVNFHKELLRGAQVAQALHRARLASALKGKKDNPSHLSYAISGYGDIILPQPELGSPRPTRRRRDRNFVRN